MRHLLLALVIALSAGAAPAVLAQGAPIALSGLKRDPNAPVEVTSDLLEVNQVAGTAIFTGNVVVVQGPMRLAAAKIDVIYARAPDGTVDTSTVDHMTATGGVTMTTGTEAAESQEAIYRPVQGEVVMTGNVLLTQGGNTIAGPKLTVNLDSGTGVMEGRVKTILQTQADKTKDGKTTDGKTKDAAAPKPADGGN